jgi:hypothetical protein
MQRGGRSKDTWVLSDAPVNSAFSLLTTTVDADDLVSSDAALASRAAENLFWFGRYGERCDASVRLLRVALSHVIDEAGGRSDGSAPSLALARRLGLIEGSAIQPLQLRRRRHASGARAGRAPAPALARRVQPARPDVGRQLARTEPADRDPVFRRHASLPLTLAWLDRAVTALMTLSGFVLDGMTRGIGWRFLSIGPSPRAAVDLVPGVAGRDRRRPLARPRLAARIRRLDGDLPVALPGRARMAAGPRHGAARRGRTRVRSHSRSRG